jgi:hypothetical protein
MDRTEKRGDKKNQKTQIVQFSGLCKLSDDIFEEYKNDTQIME